ncbi:hypothetical protein Tco_1471954, partial [Tanacetum coccineum]
VPATSSSRSSDLASKFLNFSDIPHTDKEIVSPFDVPVLHEVLNTQTTTLLPIHVSVITTIPQSLHTFTPPSLVLTPTPSLTTAATNPLSTLLDFASVFRFNVRITALEKEVAEIKKDPLHNQVTYLVDEHLDTRLEETREEFMNFLLESLTTRIIEQLIKESRDEVTLAKVSSQPQSTYKTASTLTEFELKKILLDKIEKNKDFFYSYVVYSLKRGRKDKDKDEDPSAGLDRGLKKRKLSKDAEPTTGPKKKESTSGSSKGTKSQPKSSRKYVQSEEPVLRLQTHICHKIKKGIWVIIKMNQGMRLPLDVSSSRNLHHLKNPLTLTGILARLLRMDQPEIGPAFRLLKGTRSNYAELEYNFKECYKALSEKLDWENPKGGDYPFDLSKPLPLITRGKRQRVPFGFFINNDLKYLQGGILTMTYTMSTTKTKAAKYDLPVTHVKVMKKHRYGYLEEIVVRRGDNALYRFKEGDDVVDFAIALRMYTRSLVI